MAITNSTASQSSSLFLAYLNGRLTDQALVAQAQELDEQALAEVLDQFSDMYYNQSPVLSDQIYDQLEAYYQTQYGPRITVGAPPVGDTVQHVEHVGGTDKANSVDELLAWQSKHGELKVVSPKFNGVSGILSWDGTQHQLLSRGDGVTGANLNHLLPYLDLPTNHPYKYRVRGELIISLADYQAYGTNYATSLSMVTGLVNSQTPDPELAQLLRFIPFELQQPETRSYMKGFLTLCAMFPGRDVEWFEPVDELTPLPTYERMLNECPYPLDGLVYGTQRGPVARAGRTTGGIVAFKPEDQVAVTTITDINWNISANGEYRPVLILDPRTFDDGNTVTKATGNNYGWVTSHAYSVGAEVRLIRSGGVIPKIVQLVGVGDGDYRVPAGATVQGIHLMAATGTPDQVAATLARFLEKLGIKQFGKARTRKLALAGITTISQLYETSAEAFNLAFTEGKNSTGVMGAKLYDALHNNGPVDLVQFIVASNLFPRMQARMVERLLGSGEVTIHGLPNVVDGTTKAKELWAAHVAELQDLLDAVREHVLLTYQGMNVGVF